MDPEVYMAKVETMLNRLEVAFEELAGENDPGRITQKRNGNSELIVTVKQVGDYTFTSDPAVQTLSLKSPESGLHIYSYDEANGFWKSSV